jgi:LmbE family N-acetylglucosaminyl deacetylase
MKERTRKILIVAPHCDDEVLGCGGLMSKSQTEGTPVYVAVITNGHLGAPELFGKDGTEKVRSEALQAHEFFGVRKTFFFEFPALNLSTTPGYRISLQMEDLIRKLAITDLYIPHRGDIKTDHRIVFETALVAARPINSNPVTSIYCYETLSETEWAAPFANDSFIPTVFSDITAHIDRKIEGFSIFSTQIKDSPHPRSSDAIRSLARVRGATVSVPYAESYMVIRQIN